MQNVHGPMEQQPLMVSELDIKSYLRILWRWLWLIFLCAIVAGVAAYLFSRFSTPIYQASATLLIDEAKSGPANYQDILTAERKARTYAEMMTRASTLHQVALRLNLTPETIEHDVTNVSVTPLRDTQLMKVQIEAISPSLAALVADTLPQVFIQEIHEVQGERFAESKSNLQAELDELAGAIELLQVEINEIGEARTPQQEIELARLRAALSQKQGDYARQVTELQDLRLTEAQSTDSIVVVETATLPDAPIRPRVLVNTLLATIVGVMLALGIIFLIEYLDDRLKSPRDLQLLLQLPLLGAISRFQVNGARNKKEVGGLIAALEPRNPISESYRTIRTNLQFASIDRPLRTVVVTSAVPGEGKTTTASNLAIVMAQAGFTVALVDADLRKPSLHQVFGISMSPGLVDNLLTDDKEGIRFSPERKAPRLQLMPAGRRAPNPSELLGSQRMKRLLEQLREAVDIVILDTPPVLAVADAQVLAGQADGVILVASFGTTRAAVFQAYEALMQVDAPLLGVVYNRLERSASGDYYYYQDHYYGGTQAGDGADTEDELLNNLNLQNGRGFQPAAAVNVMAARQRVVAQNGHHHKQTIS